MDDLFLVWPDGKETLNENFTSFYFTLKLGIRRSDLGRNVVVFGCLGEEEEGLTRLQDGYTGDTYTQICIYILSANIIQHRSRPSCVTVCDAGVLEKEMERLKQTFRKKRIQ